MQGYFFIDATSLMGYNGVNKCGWCGNTRNGVESGVDVQNVYLSSLINQRFRVLHKHGLQITHNKNNKTL
jgi:hypothetical protein